MHLKKTLPLSAALLAIAMPSLHAQLYWDTNGTTAGAGTGGVANGTWDTTTANWNTNSDGTDTTVANDAVNAVVFSAGTDTTSATVTLSAAQSVSSLTFEEGVVTLTGGSINAGAVDITVASGATANFNSTTFFNGTFNVEGTMYGKEFRGGGINTKTGAGTATFDRMDAQLIANGGTTIVSGGKLKNTTVNNGAKVRIVGDAFDGNRNLVINTGGTFEIASGVTDMVAQLTGSGILNGATGTQLSIGGTNNQTSTFGGSVTGSLNIVKIGTGTFTLSGTNASTGSITVSDGTFTLADGGAMTFYIGDDGLNNAIIGTGAGVTRTANLNGAFNFDLTGADLTNGNSWLIVDVANLTSASFASTFVVNGFTEDNNVWTNGSGFSFSEVTGVLSYAAVPEPAAAAMMAGLAMLAGASLRRRRSAS